MHLGKKVVEGTIKATRLSRYLSKSEEWTSKAQIEGSKWLFYLTFLMTANSQGTYKKIERYVKAEGIIM